MRPSRDLHLSIGAIRITGVTAVVLLAVVPSSVSGKVPDGGPGEPRCVLQWGEKGDAPGKFNGPIGIAISKRDDVFVTDLNNARVQKFSTDGKYLGGFEVERDVPARKSTMLGGIAIDGSGLIYLSFMLQNKVAVYTEDGKLVREWGRLGTGDGEFHQPGGMVISKHGILYVADQCNHRIQKFTTGGRFLGRWGGYGSGLGQFGAPDTAGSRFGGPHFLAIDRKGRIYTTEGVPGRIQQFSPDGRPLRAWGDKGSQPGGFGGLQTGYARGTFGPIGIFVDRQDRVWVSSLNNRVQAFTAGGKFVCGIGVGSARAPLSRPHGMAFDSSGFLYVCDASNERILKFEVSWPPMPAVRDPWE